MKRWQFWLGVLISAGFLWWALRGLRLVDIWGVVRHARVAWLVPGVAVYFLAVWARAWRWHYLLRPLKAIPTRSMFPIVCIGYMGNNIYPARAGELLRAYVLRRRQAVPISASAIPQARRIPASTPSSRQESNGRRAPGPSPAAVSPARRR